MKLVHFVLPLAVLLHGAAGATPDAAASRIEESIATDVNGAGVIVGETRDTAGVRRAVVSRQGLVTELGTLGGRNSYATAVSGHGHVVGAAHNADGYRRAFLYKPETGMVELPGLGGRASAAMAINDRGMVVGAAETPDRRWHAFLFDGTKTIDLCARIAAGDSFATGISRDGKIVGTIRASEYRSCTFVYDKGVTRILPSLAADRIVSKITEDGQFVRASNMGRRFQADGIRTGEPSAVLTGAQKFDRFMYTLLAVAFAAWVLWHVGPDLRAWWLRHRGMRGTALHCL